MLQFMRKHAKFFYIFLFLVIVSFVFFYVGPVDRNQNPVVVEIGDEKIHIDEYWRVYDRIREYYRDLYKDKFEEMEEKLNLSEKALDALIQERLLLRKATEWRITVTDEELQEAIMNEPVFQRNGVFRRDVYLRTLRLNRLTPRAYEAIKRRELMLQKVTTLIEAAVDVDEKDLSGVKGNEELVKALREAILQDKRQKVLKAFVESIKREVPVKVHRELIG